MAYDPHNLSALSYSNGFTLWHYKTPDTIDSLLSPDAWGDAYFDDAASMVRQNDFIMTNAGDGHAMLVVTENFAGHVCVADLNG